MTNPAPETGVPLRRETADVVSLVASTLAPLAREAQHVGDRGDRGRRGGTSPSSVTEPSGQGRRQVATAVFLHSFLPHRFGPVMGLWFSTIAILGAYHIAQPPVQRNAVAADRAFQIPPKQVIEVGIQLDL